jgi:hypothetical protein
VFSADFGHNILNLFGGFCDRFPGTLGNCYSGTNS